MMSSKFIPRWKGSNNASASIYETIRQHDQESEDSDVEDHAGLVNDNQTLHGNVRVDLDDESPERTQPTRSNRTTSPLQARDLMPNTDKRRSKSRWNQRGHRLVDVEEADDDVPASLLIEGNEVNRGHKSISLPPPPSMMEEPAPVLGLGEPERGEPWTRKFAADHSEATPGVLGNAASAFTNFRMTDPREKAMWRWANVMNLDNFLFDVYEYFLNHGFWSTIMSRVFNLITVAFVLGFSLFLTQCIDYRSIKGSTEMSEILIPRCASRMSFFPSLLLWLTTLAWISKVFFYAMDVRRLWHLHDFYLYLLNISEDEIQSISWQEVVSRLMALRDSHPTIASGTSNRARAYIGTQSKQRMDAHDIANRLMRKENYMIAMINKDILDMTLPIPFLRNRQLFTRTLEWNINQCIMDFVFNEKGQVRSLFLKDTHRKALSESLRRRFIFAGTANLLIAPFLIGYFLIQNFFQYFNEYQKNPAQIGSRQYNPLAEWKFREFNELWHLFQRRINMSYPFATRYINQFPKDKTVQTARFVTFVSGAIVSVLGLATIFDQESFLGFEITPGRTTIFYLGIFGGIWAVARGLLPDDNLVYDSAYAMQEVIEFTHFQPSHWEGRLHSVEVKTEFGQLYQMKIAIFMEEVLSMVFTPFVLWFSLPKCSGRIIDFFREFTVHVDGIGYVCSFAEFKLRDAGAVSAGINEDGRTGAGHMDRGENLREDYFASKDHKLEQSYWGFMNDYARNPKADIRFSYGNTRRRLNLPPPLPGLLSPTLDATRDPQGRLVNTRQGTINSPQKTTGFHSGTPRFLAQNSGSPLQSLLLDPHHQPSASGLGASPQALRPRTGLGMQSVIKGHRRTLNPPADVAEDEEIQQKVVSSHGADQSRVDLGSWKYEAEGEDDVESEDDDVQALAGEGVGVLGLIKQFQKAQGDGPRPGPVL